MRGEQVVRIFIANKDGKIEFTKQELETLLNEVWNDGYNRNYSHWWAWASPTITTPYYSTGTPMAQDGITTAHNIRVETVQM